jgi:hypothetical protein
MNELHSSNESCVYDITSPFNNEFYKEWWPWACLDIVHEFFSFFSWHLIGVQLAPKCVCSHHIHVDEQNTRVINLIFLNQGHFSFCTIVHH